jgi:hypothetical protein
MVNFLNHGAASHVSSEGCYGVTQEHLEKFAALLLEAERKKLLDLAMMLRTCAWALRRGTAPELGERALELLKKHDLLGSPLRDGREADQRTGLLAGGF